MGRRKDCQLSLCECGYTMETKCPVSARKTITCLPSTFKHSSRRVIILVLFTFTLCHHIPNANSQPLLNQLAVLLRARPPWPTSFPATAAGTQNQQQSNQQQQQQSQLVQVQQHQSSASIPQQISVQSNHVYPTSSEQLQNFMTANNLLNPQGPLSQGIPVVAMDPSQNAITIMTPTGPEQIMPPGPMGGGGGIFVAQPLPQQQHDHLTTTFHNGNNSVIAAAPAFTGTSNNGNNGQSSNNINGNTNHSPAGTILQVLHNPVTFDSQNLIDGSFFGAGGAGFPSLSSSSMSVGNIAAIPSGFSSDQHQQNPQHTHQPPSFPAGFIVHAPTGQGTNVNNAPVSNPQQQQVVAGQVPPPPPPLPKNLKGPAIIAVPKAVPTGQSPVHVPAPTYLGSPMETNLQHLSSNSNNPAPSGGGAPQPIIIRSFHQLPNLTPAFPQFISQSPQIQFPHEHLISLPENAIVNLELNKTSAMQNQAFPEIFSNFQPSQPERLFQQQLQQQQQSQYLQQQQQNQYLQQQQTQFLQQQQEQQKPQEENVGAQTQQHEEKSTFPEGNTKAELSSEIVGNPRNQRKRHQKQRQRQSSYQRQIQHYEQQKTREKLRMKPTARPTQIPLPSSESESIHNEIDRSPSISDYSLSTIINLPSTTITGSFEYPDPPTPPNFESMNALKYPSPFEDSAEVAVKNIPRKQSSSSSSRLTSRERKRLGDQFKEQLKSALHLHNSPFSEGKRKRVSPVPSSSTTAITGIHSPTAAEASSVHRTITTAAALPETSLFEGNSVTRDTTTFPAATTIIAETKQMKKDKHRRKGKSSSKGSSSKAFRPSPQIHSFEEPVSGIKSYITILPPVTSVSGSDESKSDETTPRQRGKKSLFSSKFEPGESKHPPYEVDFKPVSHYSTFTMGPGTTIPSASTTTETLYFDLIREVVSKAPNKMWSEPDMNAYRGGQREHRKLVTPTEGLISATPYNHAKNSVGPNYGFTTISSASSTDAFLKAGWKVKDHHHDNGDDGRRQLTTSSSSERVEDWRFPDTTDASKESSKIYFGNGKFGPPNCDKFHRFGFCPMNSGYPTDQVEKIASRCSALLSHLIAPLPKADVRYDVIVAKNGSMLKGRSAAPSGWSWKTFSGKPVCDTKEIKVVPGWAKNEQGEWLVILQTKAWKQEAQVTLCTPQGTHYNCNGNKRSGSKSNKGCTPIKIKCVQRFTAQRLAVLDPENTDRCPVLRSVFLPSACVCLHDSSPRPSSSSSSLSSSEEISASSSNTNTIKIGGGGGNGKSSSKTGKGNKGNKGKKTSKKSSSSKRNKKYTSSSSSGRNSRKSEGNRSRISSSEERENKSDMLDTAADSSTGGKAVGLNMGSISGTLLAKEQRHQEDESVNSPEDEDENDVHERPHTERVVSTASSITTTIGTDENEAEDEHHNNQNEVADEDDDNENNDNAKSASKSKSSTDFEDKDETEKDDARATSTMKSNSHGGSGTNADETSASEEEENFEEKKVQEEV